MKVLLFIASMDSHSQERPFFLEVAKHLLEAGHLVRYRLPLDLRYLEVDLGSPVSFYRSKERDEGVSFLSDLYHIFYDQQMNTRFPFSTLQDLMWKPDAIMVFSDPFLDFEFYNNTWLGNWSSSKSIPVIKICQNTLLFDARFDPALKSKHIDALPLFRKVFFLNALTHHRTERHLARNINAELSILDNTQFKFRMEDQSPVRRMVCLFPSTCELYMQDLIIQVWSTLFGERKDVQLCLNTFGRDTSFLKKFAAEINLDIAWESLEEMQSKSGHGFLLLSQDLNFYPFDGLLEQSEVWVLSNQTMPHRSNAIPVLGGSYNNLITALQRWDREARNGYRFEMMEAKNIKTLNGLLEAIESSD